MDAGEARDDEKDVNNDEDECGDVVDARQFVTRLRRLDTIVGGVIDVSSFVGRG